MSYLFWAQVICWAGLFIYVYSLIRKSNSLKKEIDALKRAHSETGEERIG